MPEVLVATPLRNSAVSRSYEFADGISIREVSPILWEISIVKGYVSEDDKAKINSAKYWICASQQYEYVLSDTGDELYDKARNAAMALQVLCPSGGRHIFLKFQKTNTGYDNIGALHLKELCRTLLGKLVSVENLGLDKEFDAVYAGISRAFAEKVVRFQNPVILLEQGMQTGHPSLGALMFVMALDMLFMAGGIDNFIGRVGGFLGVDSLVFPPVSSQNIQPSTVVREVLSDVYDFRNTPSPIRERCDFIATDGQRINYEDCCRIDLLLESALFMLTTCLRRMFVENLFDEVKDVEKWRLKMRVYAHRYKNSGGPAATRLRGR
jgi:hypothetical protein